MTLRRLRQTPEAETRGGTMTGWPNGWGFSDPAAIPPPGMYSQQRAGVPVTAHTSLQVDSVFTALRVLSNAVIKMGNPRAFRWATDKDNRPYKQYLKTQPSILTNTFGGMFQYDGQARTVVSMGLFQEAFWYTLTRDYLGFPTAIEVLHPAFIEKKFNHATGAIETYYGTGVQKKKLDDADLTHIPFLALPGAPRALNGIEYGGVTFALALAAMEYGQRWFSQGASPGFLLSTDQKLGTEQVERIAEKFMLEHAGLTSAHLPLVVDSGLKVEKISSTPDEAQFLGTLEYARQCIAAWFGLPSHLIGGSADKGNVWGKTVEEQGFQMVDFTLSGYTVRLNEAYSALLPRGIYVDHNESAILRANSADLAAEITALRTTGVETANEIRVTKLHMPPATGGDDLQAPLASNVAPKAADAVKSADKEDNVGSDPSGN